MDLSELQERQGALEGSLKNIEKSFHMVTGHLAEVTYQIGELLKKEPIASEDLVEDEAEPVQ